MDTSVQQSLLEDNFQIPRQNDKSILNIILSYGAAITIVVLTIIALANTNDDFNSKCGDDGKNLFDWMIFRVVLIIAEPLMLFALGYILMNFMGVTLGPIFGFVFKFIISLLSIILGTIFTLNAMRSEDCVDAMTHTSFTKSPLLGIMGWVFVSVDALMVAGLVFGMCSLMSIAMYFRDTH